MNEARQMILKNYWIAVVSIYNHSKTVYTENIIWYCH